ncbi:MAG TPA: hypothetical protein PLJ10_07705 [Candidatus Hydrogenedens sp.]|nr:hypothetical protein [Candidatus Hydrogenedens sp.]
MLTIRGIPIHHHTPITCGIKEGKILWVGAENKTKKADLGDNETIIAPLLFDAQINGGFGISVQDEKLDDIKILELSEQLLKIGVTSWVPTIVSNSLEKMAFLCSVISDAIKKHKELSSAIPGIHLEGPWISSEDGPRGAHAKEFVREPSIKDWEKYFSHLSDAILYVTLAPELKNAISFIKYLVAHKITVALGHHNATIETMQEAITAGATICTHLGNGIHNYIHRHHNPIWFALANNNLNVSIIADGHHLPEPILKVIAMCKGWRKVFLVSDATQFMGMKPGEYTEFGSQVELQKDRKLCLKGTPYLAGSATSLTDCIPVWQKATSLPLNTCFYSASVVPAKSLGVKISPFKLVPGRVTNFMLLQEKIIANRKRLIPIAIFSNDRWFIKK